MTFNRELREVFLHDYMKVNKRLYEIVESGSNSLVVDSDYITPSIDGICSMNNEEGEFKYLSRAREALERVLIDGRIDQNLVPPRAPEYWGMILQIKGGK